MCILRERRPIALIRFSKRFITPKKLRTHITKACIFRKIIVKHIIMESLIRDKSLSLWSGPLCFGSHPLILSQGFYSYLSFLHPHFPSLLDDCPWHTPPLILFILQSPLLIPCLLRLSLHLPAPLYIETPAKGYVYFLTPHSLLSSFQLGFLLTNTLLKWVFSRSQWFEFCWNQWLSSSLWEQVGWGRLRYRELI